MRSNVLTPVVAGVLLIAAGAAGADTKQSSITVSATVAANCIITSAPDLGFGTFNDAAGNTGTSALKVRCSKGTPYTIKLSEGGSGDFTQRLLYNGANTLEYNLYTTGAFGAIWGDGVGGGITQGGTGAGLSSAGEATHTIYGQLPASDANLDAPPGSYTDTIVVTVEY
jgi:spore coat protein U-like protein